MFRLLLSLALVSSLSAADWLSAAADPRHTRSQPAETEISKETAAGLKLLWKFAFEERVTAPIVLGPIYTHRGIKELVFLAGAADNLYAIDADLGRQVWKRHFDTAPSPCGTGLTATPVLAPYYGQPPEGDDASTPRRSLFVLTSDGQLHSVRPADAHDLAPARAFVPAGSAASDLTLTSSVISTDIVSGCTAAQPGQEQPGQEQPGQWSISLNANEAKPVIGPTRPEERTALLLSYRVSESLAVTRDGKPLWKSPQPPTLPPVVANGLVFAVTGSRLSVLDLETGKPLFLSEPNGPEPGTASLAIANGHVYFVAGRTLYCYGFPIEI